MTNNLTKKYLAEGWVTPQRVGLTMPKVIQQLADPPEALIAIEIAQSKILVHIDALPELDISTLKNVVTTVVGHYVNYVGFRYVLGLSYELDSIVEVQEGKNILFSAEGHVFSESEARIPSLTFIPQTFGVNEASDPAIVNHFVVSRATFELRNSIKYPDYTALHCFLAIEAIRNYFSADDKNNGWELLRDNLNVDRASIEAFKQAAGLQRHGKNTIQSWPERRLAMQSAWEILHRFIVWLNQPEQAPLGPPDFPRF